MPKNPVDTSVGSLIRGRYRLEELIGRGGMASVYRAHDDSLGREVAIKIFSPDSTDADGLRRQNGEIELLASLNHHGLVTLFDAGVDEGEPQQPFLVMELIQGDDLGKRLEDGPLAGSFTASIGADLAEALHHIHLSGVIHRDVKPANVLIAPSDLPDTAPHAKLTDFGIAMLVDGARMTATGSVIGTASYLSPEQALGRELTPASDVYSLGLVLLECLTAERAFPGTGVEAAIARIHRPPTIPSSLPTGWASLLTAMTGRDPSHRPSSLTVAQRLRGFVLADATSNAQPAEPPATTEDLVESGEPEDATRVLSMPTTVSMVPHPPTAANGTFLWADQETSSTSSEEDTITPVSGTTIPAESSEVTGETRTARPKAARRRSIAWLVAAIIVVLAGGGVIFAVTQSGNTPSQPDYPTVGGQLGNHLQQLQESVNP